MSTTVAGHAGFHPSVDPATVARTLRGRDVRETVAAAGLGVAGLILLPLGPAFAALCIWSMVARRHGGDGGPWLTHFGWCSLVILPLGFLVARGSANGAIQEAADEMQDMGYFARRQLGGMLLLFILAVLGPGVVWLAFRKMRALALFSRVSRDRAAEALAGLAAADGGVDVFTLLRPGERLDEVLPALEYLSQYDWIGASKTGERVWASSDGKRRLGVA